MPEYLRSLLLLVTANAVPWALGRLCHARWDAPLDFGLHLGDGARLFGDHKTWRGLTGSVLACALLSPALRLHWWIGATFGALALFGDAGASCLKRRLALAPGSEVPGLDQLPEALLPLIVVASPLGLGGLQIIAIAGSFTLLDLSCMRLRYGTR